MNQPFTFPQDDPADSLEPMKRCLLALGVVFLPLSFVAYLFRPGESDAVLYSTLFAEILIGMFLMLYLARRLPYRVLRIAGSIGFLATLIVVTLFVQKATAPVDWRMDIPQASSPAP